VRWFRELKNAGVVFITILQSESTEIVSYVIALTLNRDHHHTVEHLLSP